MSDATGHVYARERGVSQPNRARIWGTGSRRWQKPGACAIRVDRIVPLTPQGQKALAWAT